MKTIKASIRMTSIPLVLIVLSLLLPMPADATVYPTSVNFGEVELGSSSTMTLSVINTNRLAEINVSFSIDNELCGFTIDRREMSIPAGQRGLLRVNFAPGTTEECSTILRVESTAPEVIRVTLMGIGIMPKPAPVSNIVIGDFDTGIIDKQYEGQLISERINKCGKEAKNHGKFVSCVARLTNELKRKGIISEEEKDVIQRCAAQARIP
jgi:hypothetical protein